MALYINDSEVDALAEKLRALTQAKTKKDAVRRAIVNEIQRTRAAIPLSERLAAVKALAREVAPPLPGYDHKAFSDEMWGE